MGTQPLESFRPPEPTDRLPRQYRNPVILAQEWQRALTDLGCASRADIARELGVSRACVTQVLQLLELAPEAVSAIAALGDPLHTPVVTERRLRPLLLLPPEQQLRALRELAHSQGFSGERGQSSSTG
jgi:hypothetical protein